MDARTKLSVHISPNQAYHGEVFGSDITNWLANKSVLWKINISKHKTTLKCLFSTFAHFILPTGLVLLPLCRLHFCPLDFGLLQFCPLCFHLFRFNLFQPAFLLSDFLLSPSIWIILLMMVDCFFQLISTIIGWKLKTVTNSSLFVIWCNSVRTEGKKNTCITFVLYCSRYC